MARPVWVLNGPNLGRLGSREPDVYGKVDYAGLVRVCVEAGNEFSLAVAVRQTDSEAQLVEWLEAAAELEVPVVLNPAALTHYSQPVAAACAKRTAPLIEVHISNPHSREPFRHLSVVSRQATGTISGFGLDSYRLAITAIARLSSD